MLKFKLLALDISMTVKWDRCIWYFQFRVDGIHSLKQASSVQTLLEIYSI